MVKPQTETKHTSLASIPAAAVSFLQSSEWENFQNSEGRKTWRIAGSLIIRHDLPKGFNYLYSPRPETAPDFFREAEKIAKKEGSIFLKIDFPFGAKAPEAGKPASSLQPQKTIMVDLTEPEEAIMGAMHEKTRYNIKLARKRGVTVENLKFPVSDSSFDIFWALIRETAERDKFSAHAKAHYQKLFQVNSDNFSNELFFVFYGGKIIAAALINFYRPSGIATYIHGASSREFRDVMAPNLLHWEIIRAAKERGFAGYDFGGIDEARWPGVTRFKKGFGGEVIEYPGSVDIIYKPALYLLYKFARRLSGFL